MAIQGLHNVQILRGLTSNRSLLSCTADGKKADLFNKDDGSGRQRWEFKNIRDNIYNITILWGTTNMMRKYLSCTPDGKKVDLWDRDDGSGRQQWVVTLIENSPTCNTYWIKVFKGVTTNRIYLSCTADGTKVDLWDKDDGSGRQRWQLQEVWQA